MKRLFLYTGAVLCTSLSALAAPITWTTGPTSTANENDISLAGTLVHAGSWGTGPLSVTVGSETINFADSPTGTVLGTNPAIATAGGEFNDANAYIAPGAINANFQTIMRGVAYDGPNPKVLVLGGLEISATYQIQLFVSDDRSCCGGRTQKWSDNPVNGAGNETATFTHNSSSYVIGTFVADAVTQSIYGFGVAQSQNNINAYVLRKTANILDSDTDGIPDVYEDLYAFLDKNDPADATLDEDTDGLNNLGEYTNATLPNDPDTDNDGLDDGPEVLTHLTNPVLADTDSDTLSDGNEVNIHLTNPLSRDSDGDLFTDPWEIAQSSNPNLSTSTPNGAQLSFLGTGTGALLTSDLTDPENDGSDATLAGTNFNWVSATSSTKPNFATTEGGLNIFDNKVGGGEAKFCCDGGTWSATVHFPALTSLTHFTITSSDDAPERDPRVWQIQGSNDGVNFTNLIAFNWPQQQIWTARNQVLRVNLPSPSFPYTYIRYRVQSSGGVNNALGEIEYFGITDGSDGDNDGIPKLVEDQFAFLSDSNPADATADQDSDGLTNLQEITLGTDLELDDTDADGLSDGDEVNIHTTNPFISDTDGDTLTDGDEINLHSSNPLNIDTDNDFFKDAYEVANLSDPADANSTPDGVTVSILGTGTASLLTSDITDRENNGVESADPNNSGFDWINITASSEPNFGGFGADGEASFDVFDNKVGGGEAKWCCNGAPQDLTVEFQFPVQLTHFTVTSGNDAPERDPRAWQILGSNDGISFTPIFTMGDTTRQFWTARDQVIRFDLATPSPLYRFFRYSVTATSSTLHQLGEIEYFGIDLDTDNDGLPDYYENQFAFLDLNNPADAILDQDTDGLSNLQEFTNATIPNNADSDNDGLTDGSEINTHNTNPLDNDSDNDQISDGFEIAKSSDPNDSFSLPDFTPVDWGSPTNITGNLTDFVTTGSLVHAWTGANTEIEIPGLSLTFEPGPSLGLSFTGYDPFNRGNDANYETLLNSGTYNAQNRFLEIPGLTVGETYRIQIWLADTRNGTGGRIWNIGTYDLTDPIAELNSGVFGNEATFPGQFVTGTFTATETSHYLYIESLGFGSQYNAITVYQTSGEPEPLIVTTSGFNGAAFELTVQGFDTAKSYQLRRSQTLTNDFVDVGAPFTPAAATEVVTDPSPPAGKAFYIVEEVPSP